MYVRMYVHSPLQVPLSLALNLSLTQDSLDQTLDYSHHNTASMTPAGATVGDEADNSRAKVSQVVMRMLYIRTLYMSSSTYYVGVVRSPAQGLLMRSPVGGRPLNNRNANELCMYST